MDKPDYKGKGITNLMSSIAHSRSSSHPYDELEALPSLDLKHSKNVILLVLDGLGYKYLTTKGKNSFMNRYNMSKMTSTFPPTTATAITTFATGLPAQQSAFTGWFMFFKEANTTCAALPLSQDSENRCFQMWVLR